MRNTVAFLACLTLSAATAHAYPVGMPVSLEDLTQQADLVFKGTVLSSSPVEDGSFKQHSGFVVRETQFKIISTIKGDHSGDTFLFRHYDTEDQGWGRMFQPQYYHFEPGRSYLVFAKKDEADGVFRQLWMSHTLKEDQGVLLCPNDEKVEEKTVKEAVWNELVTMLAARNMTDVAYAVRQLDEMSGGPYLLNSLSDFDRKDVLAAVQGLMASPDPKIAHAAIRLVGSHNPYMSDERTIHWLATVGSGSFPGIGKMDTHIENIGGKLYWKQLVALVDGKAPADTRALAIRALGLVHEPLLREPIQRWLHDSEPAVRASASQLLADFPGPETRRLLTPLANDPAPQVRVSVAQTIAFSQQFEMADVLAQLLADKEYSVRRAAAMGLLAFSPENETIHAIFQENLGNKEFSPLFLLPLARDNPSKYLDALADAVEKKAEPRDFWGGRIPAFAAWEILFKHLQTLPADEVRSGNLDRYLDAMEKVGNYSSSEPRDIYAFYIQRGMTDRARKFRQAAKKAVTYDLDYYFNMVDENPSLYKRE